METIKRPIRVTKFGNVNPSDYPDFSDAYIEEAHYVDSGEQLTDEEIEEIDIEDYYDSLIESML